MSAQLVASLAAAERWFIYWLAYAFVGWAWETCLSVVLRHRLEDRGVLNGPLCPIYGFGGVMVVALLGDVANPLALFLACGTLACTLEYASSWAIEALFHVRLWDYSSKPFNINGRTYLNGFLAFGAGATLVVTIVQPWLAGVVGSWPSTALHIVAGTLLVLVAADAAVTVAGLTSFDARLARVAAALDELRSEQLKDADRRIAAADERWERASARLRSEQLKDADRRIAAADERWERASARLRSRADGMRADVDAAAEASRGRIRGTLSWQQRRLIRIFPTLVTPRGDDLAMRIRALLERRR